MKNKNAWRRVSQIAFFVLIALIAVNHTLVEGGGGIPLLGEASLHAVCPFGGVVTLYSLAADGSYVQKIHPSSLVLMVAVFVSAVLLGPVFCGWVCPFGSVQEAISALGRKIFRRKASFRIPRKVDRWLRFSRYLVLAWVLVMTAWSGKLVFSDVDPYYALFQFWTGEVAISGFVVLGAVIVASLFVERPFCKYACPYGAVLGLTNLIRIVPLKRNGATCISCKACDKACPMDINVSTAGSVRNHQCISCLACTSVDGACPVAKTLEFRIGSFEEASE